MSIFKKKLTTDINLLDLTPLPNYECEKHDDGLTEILVPRFTDPFFGKWLQPKLKYKYIHAKLDAFGTSAWELINGKNTVQEISEKLVEEHGEAIQPVYERLTKFLTQLYQNGFISFKELKGKKKWEKH